MKDKVIYSILGTLLFLIMLIGVVDAAPAPFESIVDGGLQFAYPPYETIPAYTPFTLHVHVINDTTIQTNATTSCNLHLYNSSGKHILQSAMGWDSNNVEFKLDIGAGNFTMGQHAYVIWCNNTNKQIHEVSGVFIVTPSGEDYSSTFLIGLILGMVLMALSLFYVSTLFKEDQVWIKLFFIVLGLGCLVLTTSLGVLGSNGTMIESVFKTAQLIMITITSLIMAYLFIIMFKQTINNLQNAKRNRIQAKYGNPTN